MKKLYYIFYIKQANYIWYLFLLEAKAVSVFWENNCFLIHVRSYSILVHICFRIRVIRIRFLSEKNIWNEYYPFISVPFSIHTSYTLRPLWSATLSLCRTMSYYGSRLCRTPAALSLIPLGFVRGNREDALYRTGYQRTTLLFCFVDCTARL